MSSGLIAAIVGAIGLVLAWIFGKSSGKQEIISKTNAATEKTTLTQEKELAQKTAEVVTQRTAESENINRFFNEFEINLARAREDGDMGAAIEASQVLARKALEWQKRNQK